jgi:nitroreductase
VHALIDAPIFGDPLPIERSAETLAFLARRRSASAATLREPAPTDAELRTLLTLAARVPDHGKLAPWRFVILSGQAKTAFVERLEAIAAARPNGDQLIGKLGKLRIPPLSVAVVSRHAPGKIPEWEQRLSAGAVCTLMLVAAQALGYGANWITDWYSYDAEAGLLLGLGPDEKVAGFIHLGTPAEAPLERVRPDVVALMESWRP